MSVDRLLTRQRNLHARIENSVGVERDLHAIEEIDLLLRPISHQERRSQPPVAVLSRERAAETSSSSITTSSENSLDRGSPVGAC